MRTHRQDFRELNISEEQFNGTASGMFDMAGKEINERDIPAAQIGGGMSFQNKVELLKSFLG